MHQPDQSFDGLIQPLAGDGQISDPDVELAFRLQHGRSGDAQIQRLLVNRFAVELHQLVSGWTELDCGLSVTPNVVRGLLIEILRSGDISNRAVPGGGERPQLDLSACGATIKKV